MSGVGSREAPGSSPGQAAKDAKIALIDQAVSNALSGQVTTRLEMLHRHLTSYSRPLSGQMVSIRDISASLRRHGWKKVGVLHQFGERHTTYACPIFLKAQGEAA